MYDGPMDQWTSGLMDQWTSGSMDQWTNGPMDQWTNGPMDQGTNGHSTFSCDINCIDTVMRLRVTLVTSIALID